MHLFVVVHCVSKGGGGGGRAKGRPGRKRIGVERKKNADSARDYRQRQKDKLALFEQVRGRRPLAACSR
eukprot:SAG11_NODE_3535_length_2386_cov_2.303017_3_plen_69_part_00